MPEPEANRDCWDPFRGSVAFVRDSVAKPAQGGANDKPAIYTWAMLGTLGVMVISGLGAIIGNVFYEPWLLPCALTLAGSVVVMLALAFGGDHLFGGDRDTGTWLLSRVAEAEGWSFKKVKRSVRSTTAEHESLGRNGFGAVTTSKLLPNHDPEIAPAFEKIPELMEASPGRLVFPVVQGVMRGREKNGNSFWLGAGLLDSDLSLAAAELRTDAQGREHRHGFTLTTLLAFDLETDTGIRASCLAKPDPGLGAGTFSDRFQIAVQSGDDADFERFLGSKVRDLLVDLEERYHLQFVIDGATAFFTVYDIVPANPPEALRQSITGIVDESAKVATFWREN